MIDFHTHIGRFGIHPTQGLDAAALVRKMDKDGIEKSVVLPLQDSPTKWYRRCTTDHVLMEVNRYPDRLIAFCQIDPRSGNNSPDTDFSWLIEEYKARGCLGGGEITANMYFDDPLVINLMLQYGEAGLPVVFHGTHKIGGCYGLADDAGLPRLETLLKACPDTIFCGHGMAFWSEISARVEEDTRGRYPRFPVEKPGRVVELLTKYPNLYGDLSAKSGYNALFRSPEFGYRFLEEFHDRLLFATDRMLHDMEGDKTPLVGYMKDNLENGNISRTVYQDITHNNAAGLLKL